MTDPTDPAPGADDRFSPLCHAPFVSMAFDPSGSVTACAANQRVRLGQVAEDRLLDMWNGPAIAGLRRSLEANDLSNGCDRCRAQIEAGNPSGALIRSFDFFTAERRPSWPRRIELAMSSTCNLQCVMCNGELSSSIRTQRERLPPLPSRYDDAFFEELRPFLRHAEQVRFLGGEPFLAEESFRVWEMMIEDGCTAESNVTTNGTRFTPRVERVLEHLPFSFGVSIDGTTAETVEGIRVGASFDAIMANLERFQEHTRDRGTSLSLTFCLMVENWHELGDYLLLGDRMGCQVYVNPVHSPPRHSLFRLPADELATVISTLEHQDVELAPRLGLNHEVWRGELAGLRHHAEALTRGAGDPDPGEWMPILAQLTAAGPSRLAISDALRQHLGGSRVGWLVLDAEDRIVAADAYADLPDELLLGRPSAVVRDLFYSQLGPQITILAEHQAGGVTARALRLRHERGDRVLVTTTFAEGGRAWRVASWAGASETPVRLLSTADRR